MHHRQCTEDLLTCRQSVKVSSLICISNDFNISARSTTQHPLQRT